METPNWSLTGKGLQPDGAGANGKAAGGFGTHQDAKVRGLAIPDSRYAFALLLGSWQRLVKGLWRRPLVIEA